MKILHVSLGLPPLRTGGLTRYCIELMNAQTAAGNEVCLLYPGHFMPGDVRIKRRRWKGITTYEVVNPLPVALTYGITGPLDYMVPCDRRVYENFLCSVVPDVVHVHSIMGIHKEFFVSAKEIGIPLVYTTHDYYTMCFRCTFVDKWGFPCECGPSPASCACCNMAIGMSLNKSKIMQSHAYARLKRSKLVRTVGAVVKNRMSSERSSDLETGDVGAVNIDGTTQEAYSALLSYNKSIAKLFDVLVCNSASTQARFEGFLPDAKAMLLPMTHSGLSASGESHVTFPTKRPLSIGYFGGDKTYKGIKVLRAAASLLESADIDYELHLYGGDYPTMSGVSGCIVEGPVDSSRVQSVMMTLDLVVVPSICPETFGFVVLEAVCAGVPVICSDVVGASDLVASDCIFERGSSQKLFECIMRLRERESISVRLPSDYPISMEEQVRRLALAYAAFLPKNPTDNKRLG